MLPKKQLRHQLPVALVFVASLLVGCSAHDGSGQSREKLPTNGPLADYLSVLYDEEAYADELSLHSFRETQEAIAVCMKAAGFDYTPNVEPEGGMPQAPQEEDAPSPGSLEFAKGYGYGIVEWPQGSQDPELHEPFADPNAGYYSGLTESERAAYDEALHGSTSDEGGPAASSGQEPAGCYAAAQGEKTSQFDRVQAAFADPEFRDLMAAIDTFYSNPIPVEEYEALNSRWRACVEEAGIEAAEDPSRLAERLSDEYDFLGYPDGAGSDYVDPGDRARRIFQEREIQVATADARCQQKIDYKQTETELRHTAEQQFVDEHKTALDAFVARHGLRSQ